MDPKPRPCYDELEMLIRARYPVINVISYEEERALAHIRRIAERQEKKLYTWSFNTGVVPIGLTEQSKLRSDPGTRDPLAALDRVISNIESAIFVFFDFHPYMTAFRWVFSASGWCLAD